MMMMALTSQRGLPPPSTTIVSPSRELLPELDPNRATFHQTQFRGQQQIAQLKQQEQVAALQRRNELFGLAMGMEAKHDERMHEVERFKLDREARDREAEDLAALAHGDAVHGRDLAQKYLQQQIAKQHGDHALAEQKLRNEQELQEQRAALACDLDKVKHGHAVTVAGLHNDASKRQAEIQQAKDHHQTYECQQSLEARRRTSQARMVALEASRRQGDASVEASGAQKTITKQHFNFKFFNIIFIIFKVY